MKQRLEPSFFSRDHAVVSAIVALFASGLISGALYFILLAPAIQKLDAKINGLVLGSTSTTPIPQVPQVEVVPISSRPLLSALPSELTSQPVSTVNIIRRSTAIEAEGIIQGEQTIGHAIAVTSDGWFVVPYSIIEGESTSLLALQVRGGLVSIKKIIHDKSTGYVYLKADAITMTAASFVRPELIEEGATVYAEIAPTIFVPVTLSDLALSPGWQSSEISTRRLRVISPLDAPLQGAPLRDATGRVVGMIDQFDKSLLSWLALPVGTVASDINSITANGFIQRATLGVRGIDLAQTILPTTTSTVAEPLGFLLKTSKRLGAAVKNDSPASGNMVEGDIIQRVERDVLDGSVDLASLLMDYRPGVSITFYGKRKEEVFQTKITLGTATTTEMIK